MSRTARALLSTDNLIHNLKILRQQAPQSKFIAMVKANAYGHGLRQTAARLEAYSSILGVASIDEALALRERGIRAPILLMEGVFEPAELQVASQMGFEVVFHAAHQLAWLQQLDLSDPLVAWLKVDTGMCRLGFQQQEAHEAFKLLMASKKIIGTPRVMSHLACADEPKHPLNQQQLQCFDEKVAPLSLERSVCNSAGIFSFPDHHYEYVRAGLALYGGSPFKTITAEALDLKPVMTLQSRLISVKPMRKGSTVGYGARTTLKEDATIGVVAFGYGDGYPQSTPDGTPVLVNGVVCPVLGRVSMDMMTVDVSACLAAAAGDTVVLWGEGLPIEAVAAASNNTPYNLLTGIQNRVKFEWTPLHTVATV